MKYFLFEKSAVDVLINDTRLQSIEFELSRAFIMGLRNGTKVLIEGVFSSITKNGFIFCGNKVERTYILIDLEKCNIFEKNNDQQVLTILQKTFRFAVRFWNNQAFTNCEKIFKDKTVIFPFPVSKNSANRIVIARNPDVKRLNARGINRSLLAYKYGDEGVAASVDEIPDLSIFRKGGEEYIEIYNQIKLWFERSREERKEGGEYENAIHVVELGDVEADSLFKFMNYEYQIRHLTLSQKAIVECEDMNAPIRIEGPAGTGKTASLVLRTVNILKRAKDKKQPISICFFTHSKSTENAVNEMLYSILGPDWNNEMGNQKLQVTTLQDYCMKFIHLQETQVIDLDASEAKQFQLFLIQDAFEKCRGSVFNTFRELMSQEAVEYFSTEQDNKIIIMLQYEFSIRIKGMAEGDLDLYKKVGSVKNGIPLKKDIDKEFVFRIYREYQQSLEIQSVYDTDDIILEALARLNAPLWRRARLRDGIDYMLVDEMHLFNLNEQQVFHYLTRDVEQQIIPICFAMDYGQLIGERCNYANNYIEQTLSKGQLLRQELSTVFRSSQQISELCASITASGALLFDAFVNPYKYCESSFTEREESLCDKPKLLMYENDELMLGSLEGHVKDFINKFKCQPSDIAIIFFDEDIALKNRVGRYNVQFINGRKEVLNECSSSYVVCTFPEYVNGLEYKCVILVGIDEGRVPQSGICDISSNFLKYNALNKLYISCSRAKFSVLMLGTNNRGVSSCLQHSIQNGTLRKEDAINM